MREGPALEATGLWKSYGRHRGIVDVDLVVPRGLVVGLVGANGAGKTTLMRTVLDFIRPSSGTLQVLGRDSVRESVEVRRRTTYLPGELVLPPRLTGDDVVRRFAFTRDLSPARVEEVASVLELDLSRRVQDLSKGNKQKLGLVLAFAPRAELLVLDEPTSGLDPVLQQRFAELVRSVAADGATVLLSSHVMSEVGQVASRVVLMREGRIAAYEDVATVTARARRRGRARPVEAADLPLLAARLQDTDGIDEVHTEDGEVTFALRGPATPLTRTLASVPVAALDLAHADLEDAFFGASDLPSASVRGAGGRE